MGTVMVPVAAFCGDFESERFRPRAESFKRPQKRRKTKKRREGHSRRFLLTGWAAKVRCFHKAPGRNSVHNHARFFGSDLTQPCFHGASSGFPRIRWGCRTKGTLFDLVINE